MNAVNSNPVNPELPALLERLARGLDMNREHAIGIQVKLRSIFSQEPTVVPEMDKVRAPENALEELWRLCERLESNNAELLASYRHLERII